MICVVDFFFVLHSKIVFKWILGHRVRNGDSHHLQLPFIPNTRLLGKLGYLDNLGCKCEDLNCSPTH
jgi:hypothetical protein